jgi:hypothetical protein
MDCHLQSTSVRGRGRHLVWFVGAGTIDATLSMGGLMATGSDNRSLGDLLAKLSHDTGELVRKELQLATTEITAKARKAGAQVGMAAAGGALLYAGVLVLLAMLVMVLIDLGLMAWLAALIVGVVAIVIGYVLLNRALAVLRGTSLAPRQTIETLKEDARWTTRLGA